MMQMNIERMINATGSLLIWLVMILAAVILAGLIIIVAKAISQGIKDMDRKGERKDADNNTSERWRMEKLVHIVLICAWIADQVLYWWRL